MKIFGVLGGEALSDEILRAWVDWADFVIAADAGFCNLSSAGLRPNLVVGDMDSVVHCEVPESQKMIRISAQDSSDCDKLLSVAVELGARQLSIGCMHGGRHDHLLANFASISKINLAVKVVLPLEIGVQVLPNNPITFEHSGRISLLPVVPCTGVNLSGVRWPLVDQSLAMDGLVSLSNEGSGEVTVSIESGKAMLFVHTDPSQIPTW